ncbi:MAG: hypothetical protein OXI27_05245 [Thaumarchaeota archaeon]|nr:hypothetical protein [Nitrososphaerota archaeon]
MSDRGAGMLAAVLVIAAVSGLLLLATPAITTSAQVFDENNQKVIKIGTLVTDSSAHQYRLQSMNIAVEDFNGAQSDYTLELVNLMINDPKYGALGPEKSARSGSAFAYGFENYGITYYVGPMGSTDTASVKARLAEIEPENPTEDFAVISPASTSPALRDGTDSVFRMAVADSLQAVRLANLLQAEGKEHVVLVALNVLHGSERDVWSGGLEEAFTESFGADKIYDTVSMEINHNATHRPDADEYAGWADELNRAVSGLVEQNGADSVAVMVMSYAKDLRSLVDEVTKDASLAQNLGMVKWYGPDGIATHGEAYEGANAEVGRFLSSVEFTATQFAGEETAAGAQLRAQLLEGGVPRDDISNIYIYTSYDAMTLMANAIAERDRGGNTKTVKTLIYEIARGPSGVGVLGDYDFDEAGDINRPLSYKLWTVVLDSDGEPGWVDVAETYKICR